GLCHTRPGRSDGHGGSDCGHEPRRPPAGCAAARALQPPVEHVRRRLRRLDADQLPPGREGVDRRSCVGKRQGARSRDPTRIRHDGRCRRYTGDDPGEGEPRRAARSKGRRPPRLRGRELSCDRDSRPPTPGGRERRSRLRSRVPPLLRPREWLRGALMASIRLDQVTKRFGAVTALQGRSLEIADGEFFAVLGPPGAGKTTLLRTIIGLERPDEGDVYVDGERITDVYPGDRNIAIMFQNLALYPDKSVYNNLAFPLRQAKTPKAEISRRIDET